MRKGKWTGWAIEILSLLVVGLLTIGTALAQSDRGTIAGSVVDSSGAAVSGASITVKGADTGSVYKTVTTPEGSYRVSDIAIGRYDIKVEAAGFRASLQKGIPVQINTVSAANITLQLGDVKEEVTVLADAPTLQSESSEIGTVVGAKQIEELPLALSATGQSFLRSPESFVFLVPGTASPGTSGNNIFESKISGGQNFGNEVLLDGISVQRQDVLSAFDQTAPSVEALTEFKVTTSTPSAQFGRTSGGIESFSTKSGSNAYHGSIFELFRNEALDANSWLFNYENGLNVVGGSPVVHKLQDRQNDYGGSLGGPIRIPHIYDGHDKTFFFFSWEQYHNAVGTTTESTVPTAAERNGDFSGLLGPGLTTGGTNPQPIINPCTGQQVLQNQIFDPSTTDPTNGNCRMPFPNNKINTPLSAVAQSVLKFLPLPNRTADPNGNNNFVFNSRLPIWDTTTTFRIDENLTDKSKFFFSYSSREQTHLQSTPSLPFPIDPGNYTNHYFTHYTRFGWDYLATPELLNHFTIGLNRVWTASQSLSINGSDWDKALGISGASGETFPAFSFSNGFTGYSQIGGGNDDRHIPNSLVIADSISLVKGRHSLRVGGEWRAYQFSVQNFANNSGSFGFSGAQTAYQPGTAEQNNGDPFASFLLGAPSNENLQLFTHFPRWIQHYGALYVQDDIKVRRNLTVNAGMRWDVDTPRHEAEGFQSALSLTATNPGTPGQPGAFVYGNQAIGAKTYYKDLAPRIGFAYSPDVMPNTVFRGGYSIYYAAIDYADFGNNFTVGTTANPSFSSTDNFTPIRSIDAGFTPFTPPSTDRDPTILNFQTGTNDYIAPEYGRPGMIQNWDFEVQHQIAQDLILSLGYVGQHATRLHSDLAQANVLSGQALALGSAIGDFVDGSDGKNGPAILASLGVTVPSWFVPGWGGFPGGNATIGQLLRPFPQFGNINSTDGLENLGQSTYNALQAKLERHFRNGLNLLAAYTFSKTLTDADSSFPTMTGNQSNVFGAQNPFNLRAEKQVSYQDIPQILVLSYVYELPVGPGKRFMSHGVGSKVLGGWQISGVQRYQSGSPMFVSEFATTPENFGSQLSTGNYRFSLLPGQPFFVSNPAHWTPSLGAHGYNSTCVLNSDGTLTFAGNDHIVNCPALIDPSAVSIAHGGGFVYGNLPTTFSNWRSPGYIDEDFSIVKRTQIREGQAILFKLDIPNAFNRHIFGTGGGAPETFNPTFGTPGFTFFGSPNGGLNPPRQIQATLRYEF